MQQVIIFPRGQLQDVDRAALREAGIVAIEADDPKSVVTVLPGAPLASSDDLALAALGAIVGDYANGAVGADFAKKLHKRLTTREQTKG